MRSRLCTPPRLQPTAMLWRCIEEDCAKETTTPPDTKAKTCDCGRPMRAMDVLYGEQGAT